MAKHVAFESNHLRREFASGRRQVTVVRDDPDRAITCYDEISFSVPADYRVHNDLVAAALLSLVGRSYRTVSFNLPVSERCARILRDYYALDEIGPVDPDLGPRRPGHHIGLSFSGGVGSVTLWIVLRELLMEEFRVIHVVFGAGFGREQLHSARYHKDVVCQTNFRERLGERGGRFMACVPLLFTDYLDLERVTFGNMYFHAPPLHVEHLAEGQRRRSCDTTRYCTPAASTSCASCTRSCYPASCGCSSAPRPIWLRKRCWRRRVLGRPSTPRKRSTRAKHCSTSDCRSRCRSTSGVHPSASATCWRASPYAYSPCTRCGTVARHSRISSRVVSTGSTSRALWRCRRRSRSATTRPSWTWRRTPSQHAARGVRCQLHQPLRRARLVRAGGVQGDRRRRRYLVRPES